MNKLGTILTLGIVFLCAGIKFNSVAMHANRDVAQAPQDLKILAEEIKQLDAEILKKEKELERAGNIEEFALAKELNALKKKKMNLELTFPLSAQQALLMQPPIREAIPARNCLSNRFKKLITILEDQNRNTLISFPTQNSHIGSIAWSPNGMNLMTYSYITRNSSGSGEVTGTRIKIWNTHGIQLGQDLSIPNNHSISKFSGNNSYTQSYDSNPTFQSWSWSPDGSMLAFVNNKTTIKIWEGGHEWKLDPFGNMEILSMAWSPDGTKLALGYENGAKIWNVGKKTAITLNNNMPIFSVTWSPDGSMLAGVWHSLSEESSSESDSESEIEGTSEIKIWNTATGIEIKNQQFNGSVNLIAWSSDVNTIIGLTDDNTLIWKLTGELFYLPARGSLKCSPDASKLAIGYGTTQQNGYHQHIITIWETATGKQIGQEIHDDSGYFSWSPDSNSILVKPVSSSEDIKIYSATTGKNLWHNFVGWQSAWSPDGSKLAGANFTTVYIWDVATTTTILSNPNLHYTNALAWSPDSKQLLVAGYNNNAVPTITIWDMKAFFQLRDFTKHLNIDQCDLLQAFDIAIEEKGRIHATIEQWHTFITFPKSMQNRLKIFIKPHQDSDDDN